MNKDMEVFARGLAAMDLIETDLAIALIWYADHFGIAGEMTVTNLAKLIHDLSLRGQVNNTRLIARLASHPDVVRGKSRNSFKLKLSSKDRLSSKYEPLLKSPAPKVESHVLSSDDFLATRPYLEQLVFQINGTYQFGFFDGCIVLCRRLIEMLLIESFERAGKAEAIKRSGNYVALSEVISTSRGGKFIKLARGTGDVLDEIKQAGDAGAHHRTYITKREDIDELKLKYRRVISELMSLAKIEPNRQ